MANKFPDLKNEVLICDGAMGTMIQKTGVLKPGNSPELLNLTHPEIISAIHQSYIQAGSKYISSNTFGGNRLKLEAHDLGGDQVRAINFSGVKLAREAALPFSCLVAASLGPTGKMIEPLGELSFDMAFETFREQCAIFAEAGADLITIETMSDIQETKAAILAAIDVNLPVMASVSFMENERLLTGHTPEMVAATLSGFPLLALGTNCGLSATSLLSIVQKLLAYSQKPVIVQPNAGKPTLSSDNETLYLESPVEYARACLELVRYGVRIIGGCCGTTPEHIITLKKLLAQETFNFQQPQVADYLVGKNSLINIDSINDQAIWRFQLKPGEPLWEELCQGNSEPFIDSLLEIESDLYQLIELDGLSLSESELRSFQELITVVTTYWPNPISAKLKSAAFVQALLTRNTGRSLVITDPQDTGLIKNISKFGGFYQADK